MVRTMPVSGSSAALVQSNRDILFTNKNGTVAIDNDFMRKCCPKTAPLDLVSNFSLDPVLGVCRRPPPKVNILHVVFFRNHIVVFYDVFFCCIVLLAADRGHHVGLMVLLWRQMVSCIFHVTATAVLSA